MNRTTPKCRTKLGVVSFLNSLPLIDGLTDRADLDLHTAVPALLADQLQTDQVDAALIPVIDLARGSCDPADPWQRISDACIGCDGPTMTVRIFSKVPPEQIEMLHGDADSHTSVNLARLIWKHRFGRQLRIEPLPDPKLAADCPSVLLIGDKVVTTPMHDFPYDLDLGEMWKQWTGLPFVFAVWAAPQSRCTPELADLLQQARDRGVARALEIAAGMAPQRGWPVEVAEEYFTRRIKYTLTPAALEGMRRFGQLAAAEGLITGEEALAR